MARGVLGIASAIALLTLLSKGFGFGRELVVAAVFGAGNAKDAYTAAYIIPAFSLIMLGGLTGPFHTVTQKIITTLRSRGEDDAVPGVMATIMLSVAGVMGALALAGFFGAPYLIKSVASQMRPEAFELAVRQLQVMSPLILLGALIGILCGISNDRDDFTLPSLSPLVASIAVIAVILVRPTPMALAWGTLLGGLGQFLLQAPAAVKLFRQGALLPLKFDHPEVKGLWTLLFPASVSSTIGTLNVIIGTNFASSLKAGSMSVFDYANKLIQLPLGILMTALLIPLFPVMTQAVVENDQEKLFSWMNKGLATIAFATLPLIAMFIAVGHPTVAAMYERGAFDRHATDMTYMVLVFGSLGIFTYAARDLFIRVFYAMHDSRTPLMVSLFSMGLTVALMAVLIGPFGLLGLSAATSIVTVANCLLVAFLLRRKLGRLSLTGSLPLFAKAFAAAALSAVAGWAVGLVLPLPDSFIGNVGRVVVQGGSLVLVYAVVLALLGLPVVEQLSGITRRFRPKRAVADSSESSGTALQQAP